MEQLFDFTIVKMYYHVSPEGADHPIYEVAADELFNSAMLQEALRMGGATVQATSLALPASFVGTSLCKLTLIQLLFASQVDRLIDLSPDNLIFQVELHDDHAHLGYKIKELRSVPLPADGEEHRRAFLLNHWREYFSSFITPAVEALAEAAELKPDAIWQQFGGQLTYLKDFLTSYLGEGAILDKFIRDSGQLIELLEPELFRRRRNPYQHLNPRYVENPLNPDEKWLMQSSCCLYDRRENGSKCYTCPRLTAEEREARACEMIEMAAAK
ncbi:(2Fe-2S)-binding protein [Paenibacillus sp. NEAU-GSW1]|uniref:(2Fe-2S)-binding protein n=1 Tax=Paenibacillus sp. NEAU-GSW1 TaxID=2682486 RepID=UPI001567B75C|nr:(2Fe-2S)-binding protein [Paenibacillus sp. NEAU-GSW1]